MRVSRHERRATSALAVYVIVLVGFQVFLITVAVEAFQTGDTRLGWATAAVSVVMAAGAALLQASMRS